MIKGLQGDIFDEWQKGYEVIVLFGHRGFNVISARLSFNNPFSPDVPQLPSSATDDPWHGVPQSLSDGRWFVAFCDHADQASGLKDEDVESAFREIYRLCRRYNLKRVLTNGVRGQGLPSTQADDDARVRFLFRLARRRGEVSTTFVDLRDTYTRNLT